MTTPEILRVFGAKKAGRDKWTARCPAHDDRSKNTLSITADNRGVALYCWAGCKTQDVLSSVGLSFRDLFWDVRSLPSAKLKEIREQKRAEEAAKRQQRTQDIKAVIEAVEFGANPVRTKDSFERDIEAAYR